MDNKEAVGQADKLVDDLAKSYWDLWKSAFPTVSLPEYSELLEWQKDTWRDKARSYFLAHPELLIPVDNLDYKEDAPPFQSSLIIDRYSYVSIASLIREDLNK